MMPADEVKDCDLSQWLRSIEGGYFADLYDHWCFILNDSFDLDERAEARRQLHGLIHLVPPFPLARAVLKGGINAAEARKL